MLPYSPEASMMHCTLVKCTTLYYQWHILKPKSTRTVKSLHEGRKGFLHPEENYTVTTLQLTKPGDLYTAQLDTFIPALTGLQSLPDALPGTEQVLTTQLTHHIISERRTRYRININTAIVYCLPQQVLQNVTHYLSCPTFSRKFSRKFFSDRVDRKPMSRYV